jgi:hypothetical protein
MAIKIPDRERCSNTTTEGVRCKLKKEAYGDGTLCGVHYHARRRARLGGRAVVAADAEPRSADRSARSE